MPGLVAPPEAAPLRIALPDAVDGQIRRPRSPIPRSKAPPSPSPSSSSSRPKPSPGKKKLSPAAAAASNAATEEATLDNPDLGPFLLKLARDTMASGEGAAKVLEYAIRASRSLERCEGAELELAMSLHVTAGIYCSLGRYGEAVPVLERALAVAEAGEKDEEEREGGEGKGSEHALAAFFGWMQLGDTHAMLGRLDQSISTTVLSDASSWAGSTSLPRHVRTCLGLPSFLPAASDCQMNWIRLRAQIRDEEMHSLLSIHEVRDPRGGRS